MPLLPASKIWSDGSCLFHRFSLSPRRQSDVLYSTVFAPIGCRLVRRTTLRTRLFLRDHAIARTTRGYLIGEPTAERVASGVFAEGGNAIDALVAGALAAAVAAPHQTGIGGYGASAMISLENGKTLLALDANSMAPSAMTRDHFSTKQNGKPKYDMQFGWHSAGVPGILGGLQLILDRFGTKSIQELLEPAIQICREGFRWPANLSKVIQNNATRFRNDPGSRKLYLREDQPFKEGERFKNLELADLLQSLAKANSLRPFYSGDIGQRIADGFQKNGGLVTAQDMASYEAKLFEPLQCRFGEARIATPPPTAGGLTVLQTLRLLSVLGWSSMPDGIDRTMMQVEAMRWAWRDRLTLLGDPEQVDVPIERLLSEAYAGQAAEQVRKSVRDRTPINHDIRSKPQTGTIHLSAMDDRGNAIALTLTHGGAFGSQVTVEGLGLTLGHGMSRFETAPDHPNSPGPKKRPLHNMVPSIVLEKDRFVMAAGGRGGRKIPNAMIEFLVRRVLLQQSFKEAMAAPRLHTEGSLELEFEPNRSVIEWEGMKQLGYQVKRAASATLSAVSQSPEKETGMR